MKHTPGPWAWQKIGNYRMLLAQHGLRDIIIGSLAVEMPQETYVTTNVDGLLRPVEPDNPNARLIAAAPELLEALKNIVDINGVGYGMNVSQFVTDLQPLIADAQAAIEKATGEKDLQTS